MRRYIAMEDAKKPRYVCFETEDDDELMKTTTDEREAYRFEDMYEAIAAMVSASKKTKTGWKVVSVNEWEA